MELKFIWVKEFRILKNIGINFNHAGEHSFSYQNNSILLLPNNKSVINFGNKITGITAIAGQNGSGKSSICEIVLHTTATLVNGGFGYSVEFTGIVCYGNHIFHHSDIKIDNIRELNRFGYTVIDFEKSPFEKTTAEWRESFQKGGFIYYSNVLDIRSNIEEMNLANISSQEYLVSEWKYSTGYPQGDIFIRSIEESKGGKDKQSQLELYLLGQGYRFTKFYLNFPNFPPITKPSHFILKSTYSGNNRWLDIRLFEDFEIRKPFQEFENYILGRVHQFRGVTYSEEKTKIEVNEFKELIHYLYKLNLVVAIGISKHSLPNSGKSREFIFEEKSASIISDDSNNIDRLTEIHKILVNHSKIKEGDFQPFSMSHHYENMQDWRFILLENLYLPNTEENFSYLKEFIDLEESILRMGEPNYRRISNYMLLPYFSVGENSFFTFFSRIYDVINRYKAGYDERNNLILFIDEAEIGFHPAWKQYFLKWILDFLNNQTESFTFQIILTTHSPYLLSDLPPENILLLRRDKNGNSEIVSSKKYATFGANIHELLASSFFLNDGLIGEFAKHTIQGVIDKLNEWRMNKQENEDRFKSMLQEINREKENLIQIISIISDPIVRNKLFEMYWEIFEDNTTVTQEIKLLQERINLLRNRTQNDFN